MANEPSPIRKLLLGRSPTEPLPSAAILIARVAFGLAMVLSHGTGTVIGFIENPGQYPDPLGLGPELSAGLMAFSEFVCALLVVAGLLTRMALVPLVFGFSVALLIFHAGDPFGHRELAYLYLTAWISLLILGPGRWSLDWMILRDWRNERIRAERSPAPDGIRHA